MSKKQTCLDDLKTRILTLELAPGTALDETALSAEFSLSRTPLREIFQRLAGDGYVVLHDNRGAKVTSMDLVTMRVFFQTAPLIYANIAQLAAENRTSAQLEELRKIQTLLSKSSGTRAAMLNHQFHEIIGQMANNAYLKASLTRLLIDHTRLGQTFFRPVSPEESRLVDQARAQHDAMIAALEAQDTHQMVELTLHHWDLSRDRLNRFVRPDPLPLDVHSLQERSHAI